MGQVIVIPSCAFVSQSASMSWFLYMIECKDGSIYTGITVNVTERYNAHANGKGARYTRAHPPRRLLLSIEYADRSSASKAEYEMKSLTADEKRTFCMQQGVSIRKRT